MDEIQRYKAQRIIQRIESGKFSDLDLDSLLIYVRDHISGNDLWVFKDICNFIAHPQRDRGIIKDRLDKTYYWILYLNTYNDLNLIDALRFPVWLRKFLLLQLEDFREESLPYSKKRARQILNIPKPQPETDTLDISANMPFVQLAKILIETFTVESIFSQKDFIKGLIAAMQHCGLLFNEDNFYLNGDKITVCLIYILYGKVINVVESESTKISLSLDNDGKILLMGSVKIFTNTISFCIVDTELIYSKWSNEIGLLAAIFDE